MRDRQWRAGLLLGLVIATRIFPWPLVVWLLLTRRLQAAAVAAASSIVLSGLGWAVVSFERIDEFPAVTQSNASEFVNQGVSVAAIVANLGASPGAIGAVLLTSRRTDVGSRRPSPRSGSGVLRLDDRCDAPSLTHRLGALLRGDARPAGARQPVPLASVAPPVHHRTAADRRPRSRPEDPGCGDRRRVHVPCGQADAWSTGGPTQTGDDRGPSDKSGSQRTRCERADAGT